MQLPPRPLCFFGQGYIMWYSIALDDSPDEADVDWEYLDPRYDVPNTPSTTSEEAPPPRPYGQESSDADSDEEYAAQARSQVPRRKPGGYDSRIEQILYENPELPILITDAGKSLENGGKYIVYTIRTGVSFDLLACTRACLINVFWIRTSKCDDGIPSSPRFGMLLPDFIPRSSSHRYPRSTPWQTTPQTRRMRSRTSRSST